MTIATESAFEVDRSPDAVWAFLTDPRSVVACIPGARIVRPLGDDAYEGEIRVGVGFLRLTFRGTLRYEELDREALRARLSGSARAAGGWGETHFEIASQLVSRDEGRTRVEAHQTTEIRGRMTRFGGRRLVQEIADILFGRFGACVKAKLERGA